MAGHSSFLRVVLCGLLVIAAPGLAVAQYSGFNGSLRVVQAVSSLESGAIAERGSTLDFDSGLGLGVDLGYEIFRGLEVQLALSSAKHDLATAGGEHPDLAGGDLWISPVTLTLRYSFFPLEKVQPYVGLGVGTAFSSSYSGTPALRELGVHDLKLDLDPGLVLQAGLDYPQSERWFITLDLRYVQLDGNIDLSFANGVVFDSPAIDGNHLLIGLGAALRF